VSEVNRAVGSAITYVDVKGRPEDRRALSQAFRKGRSWSGRAPVLLAALVFALVVIFGRLAFASLWKMPPGAAATLAAFIGLVLFLTVLDAFGKTQARQLSDPRGTFLKGFRISLADDGVDIAGESFTSHHRWDGVLRLQETPGHLFLYTDGAQAIIVPKRCFPSPGEAARFADVVRAHITP
jgi:hypothetical protein